MTATVDDLDLTPPEQDLIDMQNWLVRNFGVIQQQLTDGVGITDTFTTVDGKTVTVNDGIITGIV